MEPDKQFMAAQKTVYDHLSEEYYSYSGPTSMGKSYLMRIFVKQQILSGSQNNFAFVVPTKALINEVRYKITDELKESLHNKNYHIVTAVGDAALKLDDEERKYIFIMTPERLLYMLINEPDVVIELPVYR
jgi:replicative superfamily II helicase